MVARSMVLSNTAALRRNEPKKAKTSFDLDQGPTETETRNRNLGRRTLAQGSSDDIHAELRRCGVTLALLWKECRGHHPDGDGYDLYVVWRHGITATMRQAHGAGEMLFVDF